MTTAKGILQCDGLYRGLADRMYNIISDSPFSYADSNDAYHNAQNDDTQQNDKSKSYGTRHLLKFKTYQVW